MYVLACDAASEEYFAPLAAECGFVCISGPKEDVLSRFCQVIRKIGAVTILRATGDNPFVFHEAAEASLNKYASLVKEGRKIDYFTYSGLPHGSGVEVMDGRSLLRAETMTDSSWDREHVGPALYNHTDEFVCVRETAPDSWYFPSMRTTIDTKEDYDRAVLMYRYLTGHGISFPPSVSETVAAWSYATRPVVCIPSVSEGQGTGHFVRIGSLVRSLRENWQISVYVPPDMEIPFSIPEDIAPCVVHSLPARAHLIILDHFQTDSDQMERLSSIGPVVALDEGGQGRTRADYLLDIIPALGRQRIGANRRDHSFIPLPKNRRMTLPDTVRTVLVVAGGENAAGLARPVADMLVLLNYDVTVVDPAASGLQRTSTSLVITGPIENLREKLCHYDLVVTHYGFTAIEAAAAGCRVLLFAPSHYHYRLGREYGFQVLPVDRISLNAIEKMLRTPYVPPSVPGIGSVQCDLVSEMIRLAGGSRNSCPLCGNTVRPRILFRAPDRSMARCSSCGMIYLHFFAGSTSAYTKSYFFEEYRSQYGKTYLEDFNAIRGTGLQRMQIINTLQKHSLPHLEPAQKSLLDIGCAYGPFLDAARFRLWRPFGTDINEDAVAYVRDTLGISAVVSSFPAPDRDMLLDSNRFAAITLWYVIEHFSDLEPVFRRIRKLLMPGGILAFSTPSASGISARTNMKRFLERSPTDHYTIWASSHVRKQLMRYGFTVQKIRSTGHHPERFPGASAIKAHSLLWKILYMTSRLFSLGDTFEVYAVKNGDLEDIDS